MRKTLFSSIALVAALALFVAADKADKQTAGPKPGDEAPAFTLQDQEGKNVSLSDYSGKIVVLEWFNEECPFVVKHYKNGNMNETANKYKEKDVVWLAINSTSGKTSDNMKTVAANWKMDRPILMDSSGATGKAYGSKNTPTMYVISKEGKVLYRGAIDNKSDNKTESIANSTNYVAKALDEILAGKPVSEPMTKAYGCSVKYAN